VPAEQPELDLFEAFCRDALTIEDGSPLRLYPFQRRMLADLFGGVRETVILIPKKNGKSTILGALAIFHLCTTPDAECVIAAASRDQAALMLRQAQGFIRRSPGLQERLLVKQREIIHRELGGRIRILASDVDTADGVIPTLALVDELHRHKSDELYGIFRDGLGPRGGRMVTISTAGDSSETPLGRLRAAAYARRGMKRDGCYRYVRGKSFAFHEWALDPEDDPDDLDLVKQANPAPWQTIKELRGRHDSDSMRRWQWQRFACGQWVGGEEAAVSDREWRAAAKAGLSIPANAEPMIGIDIGRRVDSTGIVAVWSPEDSDEILVEPLAIIAPPGDGTSTPEEAIWEPLEAAAERWPRATFIADPKLGGDLFLERVEREFPSVRTAVFDQVATALARMAAQFSEALASGRLSHSDDPALNAHVLAAAARPVGEQFRFIKQRRKKLPIDGLIALCMALSVLIGESREEPEATYAVAAW